jgi:hypothetical protein
MDPQFDRGNLKIPEMYADWLITTGGGTAGMCLHFQDGLLCEGVPSAQAMWSLTALRCSELPLLSLATICRIKARSDFSCTFAQHGGTIFSCVTFNFNSQTSVPGIRYLIGLCRAGPIKKAKHPREANHLPRRCWYDAHICKTSNCPASPFSL